MDTNILAATTNIVQTASQSTVTALNWNLIVMAIIGLITTVVSSITAVLVARVSKNSEITKNTAAETSESVKAIHVAVNSERSAMLERVDKLKNEILEISTKKATLEEKERVSLAVVPAPVTTTFNNEQLKQIIEALKNKE